MKFDKLVNLYLESVAGSPESSHNGGMKNKTKLDIIDRIIDEIGDLVSDGEINSAADVSDYLGGSEKLKEIVGKGVEAEMNDDSDGDNLEHIWSVVAAELEKLPIEDFNGWEK